MTIANMVGRIIELERENENLRKLIEEKNKLIAELVRENQAYRTVVGRWEAKDGKSTK